MALSHANNTIKSIGGGSKRQEQGNDGGGNADGKTANDGSVRHCNNTGARKPKPIPPSTSSVLLELLEHQKTEPLAASPKAKVAAAAAAHQNMSGSNPSNGGEGGSADDPIVPRLLDIYEDLAQSSTPQTSLGAPPLPPLPRGVYRHHAQQGHGQPYTAASARPRRAAKRPRAAEEAPERVASAGRGGGGGRKKGKGSGADQRWSKRFTWPDELHRDFVSAIFDVGLKHSSPSAIMEHMAANPDLTSERVKSHLQKYRLNRKKSRAEFMGSYDSALEGFRKRGSDGGEGLGEGLSCGEAAALCTHESQIEPREGSRGPSPVLPVSSASQVSVDEGAHVLRLPLLTVAEKDGPVGQAFGYLVGMYNALSRQLEDGRRQAGGPAPAPRRQETRQQHPPATQPSQQHQVVYHQPVVQSGFVQHAVATSLQESAIDPTMHEVAASIPHATYMPVQTYTNAPQYSQVQVVAAPAQSIQYAPQQQQQQQQQPRYAHVAPAPQPSYPPREVRAQKTADSQPASGAPAAQPQPAAAQATTAAPASTTTLRAQEESAAMQQEMRGQMAFQNKMRALKRIELNKYGAEDRGAAGDEHGHQDDASGGLSPLHNAGDDLIWNPDDDGAIFDFLIGE
ncbi:hypothetical protein ACHAXT_000683 [Thalassiosira profunda]